jgi:hypothetical protein
VRPRLLAGVAALAATAGLVLVNALGERFHLRADVTGTAEQTLAPRTRQTLARLDKPYSVVIAVDFRTTDPRSRQRAADVLEEIRRETPRVTYRFIDTGSASGVEAYRGVVKELIEREAPTLAQQSASIELASGGAASLASYLSDTLSPALLTMQQAIAPSTPAEQEQRASLERNAAGARLAARDLNEAVGRAADALKQKLGDAALPATDRAAGLLSQAFAGAIDVLAAAARDLRSLADASTGPASDEARGVLPKVQERRDQSAVVHESLRRLRRPDVLRVAEALSRGSAALVVGPPGVGLTSIDVDSLLPAGSLLDASDAGRADQRKRDEELISTAIASLMAPSRPVVVIVHAETSEFVESSDAVRALAMRLRLRGIDLIEWPVLLADKPPRLASVDPDRKRPVVYMAWSPDSSAAGGTGLNGVQRAAKLGEVMARLAGQGQNIALSLNHSVAPAMGDTDPMLPVLARFGLGADSGRPLLRERLSGRGRAVDTDLVATPAVGSHPLSGAVRGLPAMFPWSVSLFERPVGEKARVSIVPLYVIPASPDVWAESQWLRLWQTPRDQRAYLPELPDYTEGRDSRWPDGKQTPNPQRWLIAAAVERAELGTPVQRCLAVGSNSWFMDAVTQQQLVGPDGRQGLRNPGNLELFEAGVAWLANQDDLIAQSPSATATALIAPIGERALTNLRFAVVLGMPALVLIAGMLFRAVRG